MNAQFRKPALAHSITDQNDEWERFVRNSLQLPFAIFPLNRKPGFYFVAKKGKELWCERSRFFEMSKQLNMILSGGLVQRDSIIFAEFARHNLVAVLGFKVFL